MRKIMLLFIGAIAAIALTASNPVTAKSEICANTEVVGIENLSACQMTHLSWVEVSYWNEESKNVVGVSSGEIEFLIRSTSRRLLPELRHEIVNIKFFDKEIMTNKRARIKCEIGAVKNNIIVGYYVECELNRYSEIQKYMIPDFSSELIGTSGVNSIKYEINNAIRSVIQRISDNFYQRISDWEARMSKD